MNFLEEKQALDTEPLGSQRAFAAPPVSKKVAKPVFPSGGLIAGKEISKWLMLWWFSGYSEAKIRTLLLCYYPQIQREPAYDVSNIEQTFRKLQQAANRKDSNYLKDPYMYHIMTSPRCSPWNFRASALRWLEKNQPDIAKAATDDEDSQEMRNWYVRWMEEAKLMKKAKAKNYRERARDFMGELEEAFEPYFGEEAWEEFQLENSQHSQESLVESQDSASELRSYGDNDKREVIPRPELVIETSKPSRRSRFTRKIKGKPELEQESESPRTPGPAQHLDDLGFFKRRPRNVEMDESGRKMSTSDAESVASSKVSVPGDLEHEYRDHEAEGV